MLRSTTRVALSVATIAALTLVFAAPALAHEQRTVGAYQLTVGWQHEPTYAGEENGVQIFIHDAKGTPIDDLGTPTSLKVQVIYGSATSPFLDLEPSWDPDTGLGTHGEWDAAITPTEPGNYTFHFTGSINGQAIDQKFTSSDSTFDPVKSPTAIEFPTKTPSAAELAAGVEALQPRVASASDAASSAKSSASTATTLGIVALVVAVVAGGAAIVISLAGRKGRA